MVSKRLVFLILAAGLLTSATRPGFAEKPLRLFFEKNIETAKRPEPQTHTVREGEWLIRILEEKGYTRQEIRELLPVVKELNPDITDLNKLRPGQTLQLPDEPPAILKIRPAIPPESKKKTYTVESDKIWRVQIRPTLHADCKFLRFGLCGSYSELLSVSHELLSVQSQL